MKSDQPLLKDCKQAIALLGLLYLHNNLNYTQKNQFNASLHMGQLKGTLDGTDLIKSSRFYRPLFLRSLPKNWLPSNANVGVRTNFEMKRPRVEPPTARSEFQFQSAPLAGPGQQHSTQSPDQSMSLETRDSQNPIILEETSCPARASTV